MIAHQCASASVLIAFFMEHALNPLCIDCIVRIDLYCEYCEYDCASVRISQALDCKAGLYWWAETVRLFPAVIAFGNLNNEDVASPGLRMLCQRCIC